MTLTKPIGYTTLPPGTVFFQEGKRYIVGVKGELFPIRLLTQQTK